MTQNESLSHIILEHNGYFPLDHPLDQVNTVLHRNDRKDFKDFFYFSLTVSLFVFLVALACLLSRPSAKRTILLTTPLPPLFTFSRPKCRRKNSDADERKTDVNPVYWWIVQPGEETGLKEGRFSLARSSQKVFPHDPEKTRRSSSLYTESSGDLSRHSSISMTTLLSSLHLTRQDSSVSASTCLSSSSVSTRTTSFSENNTDASSSSSGFKKERTSFLHGFLKSSNSGAS